MVHTFDYNNDKFAFHTVRNQQNRVDTACLVNGLVKGIAKQHPNDQHKYSIKIGFRIALVRAISSRPRHERKAIMACMEDAFASHL